MIIDRYMIQNREDLFLKNLMNPMFGDPKPHNKQDFWKLIDHWKAYLANEYGLRKGQVVGWGVAKNNVNCHAIMFAIAELGAQIFPAHLAWHPEAKTDTVSTTLRPEFGFWDNVTLNMLEGAQGKFYGKYLDYEMINIDEVDIVNYNEEMDYMPPDVFPEDPFFITYSDGLCEDGFEFQYYTHQEAWGLAHRHYKLFNMKDTIGVHTFNFMHCMSFITYSLAAYMGCKEHYVLNWWDRVDQWKPAMLKMLQEVYNRPERKVIFFKNEETLRHSLSVIDDTGKETTRFICPYGESTQSLHDICHDFNIRATVLYGETRAKALTLFVKPINPDSLFIEDSIGFVPDNYYECVYSPQKGVMFVRGYHDSVYRSFSFSVEKMETGEYIHKGLVEKHPHQKRVEEILGHSDFFLLRKYGESYLAVYEEPKPEQYELLDILGLTHIAVIDRMAYCLENKRYRDWFALKNQFWYGFDSYEEGRVRYYNGEG